MKSLVIWGRGPLALARQRVMEGARLLAWEAAAAEELTREGIACQTRAELLSREDRDAIDRAAVVWTKSWGRRPLLDGRSFHELLAWKGVSLWWFAELYLHHSTGAARRVRLIETFHRLLQREAPDEVEAVGLGDEPRLLLERAATAQRILYQGRPARRRRGTGHAASWRSRWNAVKTLAGACKARLLGAPAPRPPERARVLFLSHAAFWRVRRDAAGGEAREFEHYFDRLIPEVDASPELEAHVVAVGPRAAFRRRGPRQQLRDWLGLRTLGPYLPIARHTSLDVYRETRRATAHCRELWRQLRRSPALGEAFSHRGVRFHDLSQGDLAATLLLQLPWAVRSFEEMSGALAAARPAVVCLYAESSGWGRAALAACRAAGVPTVAIQHGILYPGYYSYLHGPDETECPIPDRTAVFGEAARRFLIREGSYPARSLVVTGSPKFDGLVEASKRWDRDRLRAQLGVGPEERLVVVASRYRGIRETHQSIGTAFAGLVRAVEAIPGVRLLVKPHPAEPAHEYRERIRELGARRSRVLPGSADLMELLHAGDALCTVESLSAVEALVLGRPVLVLNTPTNLDEMVERGAALGVPEGGDPQPMLEALLFDAETRRRLDVARREYLGDVARGVDGGATARIVALLAQTARRPPVVPSGACD